MGHIEILEKLNTELQKDIQDECQVIYILSRIRKYLEDKNEKKQYIYLNFYCNWALHSRINDTKAVNVILNDFISGKDSGFLNFDYLKNDLKTF
ncbi:MAG: hypothetical protein WC842_03420 [Candidatus Paceibacterota bacterium]|jgi:hypothetical protein